jgi:hypothetical protein
MQRKVNVIKKVNASTNTRERLESPAKNKKSPFQRKRLLKQQE